MVPQSDLNETNKTTSFWMFLTRTKTEVCPTLWGVDDLPFLQKNHTFFP